MSPSHPNQGPQGSRKRNERPLALANPDSFPLQSAEGFVKCCWAGFPHLPILGFVNWQACVALLFGVVTPGMLCVTQDLLGEEGRRGLLRSALMLVDGAAAFSRIAHLWG